MRRNSLKLGMALNEEELAPIEASSSDFLG